MGLGRRDHRGRGGERVGDRVHPIDRLPGHRRSDPAQKTSGNDAYSSLPIANAFVVELDPTGSQEKYGTFWGGTGDDFGMGIALDGSGDVIAAGFISGTGKYPTTTKRVPKVRERIPAEVPPVTERYRGQVQGPT